MDEKNLTQLLIVNTFKDLMSSKEFNKIPVKMIAAEAGIIRSTFYNYFQDKYDVLEWIVKTEITDNVTLLIQKKMYAEALKLLFSCLNDDRAFFAKAFKITGQNGFEEILANAFTRMFLDVYKYTKFEYSNRVITRNNIAQYQSIALVMYIKMWLCDDCYGDATVDEVCDAYIFMLIQGNSMVSQVPFTDIIAEKLLQNLPSPLKKLPVIRNKIHK